MRVVVVSLFEARHGLKVARGDRGLECARDEVLNRGIDWVRLQGLEKGRKARRQGQAGGRHLKVGCSE